jgi:hypothetical protein
MLGDVGGNAKARFWALNRSTSASKAEIRLSR